MEKTVHIETKAEAISTRLLAALHPSDGENIAAMLAALGTVVMTVACASNDPIRFTGLFIDAFLRVAPDILIENRALRKNPANDA